MKETLGAWGMTAARCAALAVFAAHFLITGLYLTPLNPVKVELSPLIALYMEPLFSQNWHLFAPSPVSTNLTLMARCRYADSAAESGWLDVTQAVLTRLHRNRVSPMSRIARMHVGAMHNYLFGDTSLDETLVRRLCSAEPDRPVCRRGEERSQTLRREAESLLAGLGAAGCRDVSPGLPVSEVNLRIADHKFPRFSKRHSPDSEGVVAYVDLGWRPAPTVGPR